MPFYKDPMSYGNLIVEFKVDFPKKNFFGKDKLDKIAQILSKEKPKSGNEKRDPKTNKILEDYNEADLNPNPAGGH
jgi:DnaJ family protein A protein 2